MLSDIYKYQNDGLVYVCGDFNSRCGDLDDFIRGVDDVCDRNVIDFSLNSYGKILIEFLINTNMCMLNGRGSGNNDFTSVSTIGNAVVDYCFVEHSRMCNFSDFSVILTTDLMNRSSNRHFSLLNVNAAGACGYDFLCDGGRLVRAYVRLRRGAI